MIVLQTNKIEFIPTKEKEEENPVTFYLSIPTMETALKIQQIFLESAAKKALENSELTEEELSKLPVDNVTLIKTVLLDCVKGWKNVKYTDAKGELQDLEFTKENFMYINDLETILELFNKVNELSIVPKQKKKKSS